MRPSSSGSPDSSSGSAWTGAVNSRTVRMVGCTSSWVSSEIVSGALQDAGRAQIVGVKTYGTGTVLGEFSLSDGSALRIGTVEWLTPSGRQIWHEGITPDVIVERASDIAPLDPRDVGKMSPAQVKALTDLQLARALALVQAVAATTN